MQSICKKYRGLKGEIVWKTKKKNFYYQEMKKMNKYEEALNEIKESYDAFYFQNKYGEGTTHKKTI